MQDPNARKTTKVKLVRDAIGGVQMVTENNELLKNVFVKSAERIKGSVMRMHLEVIFLSPDEKVNNW